MNEFITIKSSDGTYLPMAFIVRNNEAGRSSLERKDIQKLLDEGDSFVVVSFNEITNI